MENVLQRVEDPAPEYSARCREHAAASFAIKRDLSKGVIALGRRLLVVRKALPKDAYRRWLRLHFGWNAGVAAVFIRAARHFDIEDFDVVDPWVLLMFGSRRSSAKLAAVAVRQAKAGRCITRQAARKILAAGEPAGDQAADVDAGDVAK